MTSQARDIAVKAPAVALAAISVGCVLLIASATYGWISLGGAGAAVAQAGLQDLPRKFGAPPPPAGPDRVIPLGRKSIRVPILQYHYIRIDANPRDRLGFNLSVTPVAFAAQMRWLAAHHYHPVNFDDLRAYFAGRTPLPADPVVLTFDDGYLDFYTTAFPVLEQYRFKAVAYIVPGFFGRPAYMTPEQIQEIDASGLVEIASHTMNHVDLTRASAPELAFQLDTSMSVLVRTVGHPVVDFCYPSGKFNPAAVAAVEAAGYSTATTEMPGIDLSWSTRLLWPRVRVAGGEDLASFIAHLGSPEPTIVEASPARTSTPTPTVR